MKREAEEKDNNDSKREAAVDLIQSGTSVQGILCWLVHSGRT